MNIAALNDTHMRSLAIFFCRLLVIAASVLRYDCSFFFNQLVSMRGTAEFISSMPVFEFYLPVAYRFILTAGFAADSAGQFDCVERRFPAICYTNVK